MNCDFEAAENAVLQQLVLIGEDTTREGLVDTPKRIVKMWQHIFSGYSKNPADVFTTFDSGNYDEMIILRNIEVYSMCEHHMLPFFGKAHIAYIPNDKVIGVSKLARLLEIYSRRMQIQERIGDQVTADLMKYLNAKGAACIIQATHMCMRMRGVEKQQSEMITSSLTGVFKTDSTVRNELLALIKQ